MQEKQTWDISPSWDEHFVDLARSVAGKSRDPSTKCGCVIVSENHEMLTTGYNGFPRGCYYTLERAEREVKYQWISHAESNAITNAARLGHALLGSTAYITAPPCHECAKQLIQAGVKRIVVPEFHNFKDRVHAGNYKDAWVKSCDIALEMFAEAGVRFNIIPNV